jgi:hypothetical protein
MLGFFAHGNGVDYETLQSLSRPDRQGFDDTSSWRSGSCGGKLFWRYNKPDADKHQLAVHGLRDLALSMHVRRRSAKQMAGRGVTRRLAVDNS